MPAEGRLVAGAWGPGDARPTRGRRAAGVVAVAVLSVVVFGAMIALVLSGGGDDHPAGHAAPPAAAAAAAGAPSAADIGFSQDMTAHHNQAVTMSRVAERRGSAQVRGLADGIITAQLVEVGWMQGWLELWGAPAVPTGQPMTWMHDAGEGHGGSGEHAGHEMAAGGSQVADDTVTMPGMATQTELAGLDELSGRRFDVRFLQLMIRHHQGGIEMARVATERARLKPVRELAGRAAREQVEEIGLMLSLLRTAGGRPLPSP